MQELSLYNVTKSGGQTNHLKHLIKIKNIIFSSRSQNTLHITQASVFILLLLNISSPETGSKTDQKNINSVSHNSRWHALKDSNP